MSSPRQTSKQAPDKRASACRGDRGPTPDSFPRNSTRGRLWALGFQNITGLGLEVAIRGAFTVQGRGGHGTSLRPFSEEGGRSRSVCYYRVSRGFPFLHRRASVSRWVSGGGGGALFFFRLFYVYFHAMHPRGHRKTEIFRMRKTK